MNKIEKNPVTVIVRDINGNRQQITFDTWGAVWNAGVYISEEDEIMLVYVGDVCVWCALGHDPIDLEDIIGFFA